MNKQPPPIFLLGTDCRTGLQTTRILAREGLAVHGVADQPASPYCRTRRARQQIHGDVFRADFSSWLRGGQSGEDPVLPVLLPCTDDWVFWVAENRDRLTPYCRFTLGPHQALLTLAEKNRLVRYASEQDLPIPRTVFLSSRTEAETAASDLNFPVVMKPPVRTAAWLNATGGEKVLRLSSRQELVQAADLYLSLAGELIVQEWIPGEDDQMYSCYFFSDGEARVRASLVVRKLRQWPVDTGCGSLAVQVDNPEIQDITTRLLQGLGYCGLGSIQFKRHAETGAYYIIEVNVGRPALNMPAAEACGVPMMVSYYRGTAGLPLPEDLGIKRTGGKWICWKTDLASALEHHRRGQLSISEWLKTLRGPKTSSVFSLSDPVPSVLDLFSKGSRLVSAKKAQPRKRPPGPGTSVTREPPVIVAGLTLNGSTVTRRLCQQGVPVWSVSFNPDEQGWRSRYGKKHLCPNPDEDYDAWLGFMRDLAAASPEPPLVLPMSDTFVVAFDKAAKEPDWPLRLYGMGSGLRTRLTCKRSTFEMAAQHRFPCPLTRYIQSRDELAAFYEEVEDAKVLIKPDLPSTWRTGEAGRIASGRKVMVADTLDELIASYDLMAPFTPGVLAQEVIPGDDPQLIYWCGFMGPGGQMGGSLIGRKLRVLPIHYGSASFVELVDLPKVDEDCCKFLADLNYEGLCGIELKEDPRDGIGKLIEVNPRYGLWDDLGAPRGVDLVREAVDAVRGGTVIRKQPSSYGLKWLSIGRDLGALWHYRKEGSLTLGAWLRSLAPPLYINDFPLLSDPRFAMHTIQSRFAKLLNKKARDAS